MQESFKKRFRAIQEIGCICCILHGIPDNPPDIHHLLSGGRRLGHLQTLGLCPWHHRGVGVGPGPSLAHGSKPFRETYGTDEELLKFQNYLIDQAGFFRVADKLQLGKDQIIGKLKG